MHIAFDYQAFSLQTHGGISRYLSEIAPRLNAMAGMRCTIVSGAHRNAYLDRVDCPQAGVRVPHVRALTPLRHAANALFTRAWLARHPPDVVHETYYLARRLAPASSAVVVTVHDMIHEKFPEMFPASDSTARRKAAAVARADAVICVSENTRQDLLAHLSVEPDRTLVVHHGCRAPSARPAAGRGRRPVLLYVGPRDGYKNWVTLLGAFSSEPRLRDGFDLVCFGGRPFTSAEDAAIHGAGLRPDAVQYMQGDDDALSAMYARASALVYPSLYEGFGLPPLEAMAAGCPVVLSRSSSLPEVFGGAAAMFDPTSAADLARTIVAVVLDPERAGALRGAGLVRAGQLTWDRCATATREVYRTAMENRDRRLASTGRGRRPAAGPASA